MAKNCLVPTSCHNFHWAHLKGLKQYHKGPNNNIHSNVSRVPTSFFISCHLLQPKPQTMLVQTQIDDLCVLNQ